MIDLELVYDVWSLLFCCIRSKVPTRHGMGREALFRAEQIRKDYWKITRCERS